jgi:4-amino-4-deoxy-L-arabinose transferase-like glycosyltransferase
MAALLPLLTLGLAAAALYSGRTNSESDLREDLLKATLIVGVAVSVGTELIGAIHAISFAGVLLFWLAALTAAGLAVASRWRRAALATPIRFPKLGRTDAMLVGGIATVALLTLLVAWLSPPQSSDSISYHMGRVMHWIQNRSVGPYPAHDTRQLFDPPFAEMVRLHLFLLGGGDRSGCLLQWLAAMGSLAAASLVARDLGGGRRAQIFAAVFAVTLPIGITQATSGKTDWVEAFWLLAMVHFSGAASRNRQDRPSRGGVVLAAAALGLAISTKVTAWVFAPAFLLAAVARTPRTKLRGLIAPAVAGVVLVAAMTAPYLQRNLAVFGKGLSDPRFDADNGIARITPSTVVSNAIRNAMFQFGTPSSFVNRALLKAVVVAHWMIGVDPFDRSTSLGRFGIERPSTVEEAATSPLHLLLLAGAGLTLLVWRRRQNPPRLLYLGALGSGYLFFCAEVRWAPTTCRLLMPLLVLGAPMVAAVAVDWAGWRAILPISALLFVGSIPYVVHTSARPLSFAPGRGILATPRIELYFARVPELRASYEDVARTVRERGVHSLGVVVTNSIQPEYLLWMLLRDVKPAVRIENVNVINASAAFESAEPFRDFRPEMIVAFDGNVDHPRFAREIVIGGTKYPFVRAFGSAAYYAAPRQVSTLLFPSSSGNRARSRGKRRQKRRDKFQAPRRVELLPLFH